MEEGSLVRRSCRLQQRHQEQRGFAFPADLMNDGDGNGETMQQKGRLRRAVDTAGPDLGTGLWQGPRAGSFGAATDEALLQDLEDQECDVDGDRMQGGTAGLGPGGAGAARGASAGRSSGRGSGSSELAAVGRRCRAPSRCATEQGQDRCSARACSRQQREVLQAASAAAPRRLGSAAREEAGQGPGGPEEGVSGSLGDGDQDEEDLPVKDSLDSFIVGTLEAEEGDEGDEEEGDGEGALPSPGVDPCFEDAEDVRLWYMVSSVTFVKRKSACVAVRPLRRWDTTTVHHAYGAAGVPWYTVYALIALPSCRPTVPFLVWPLNCFPFLCLDNPSWTWCMSSCLTRSWETGAAAKKVCFRWRST